MTKPSAISIAAGFGIAAFCGRTQLSEEHWCPQALLAVPAWFTVAVFIFRVQMSVKLIVGVVLATSLASPVAGLLAVAALAPLGSLLSQLVDGGTFRMSEAVVLAFFTGWLLRALEDRPGPGVPSTVGW